MSDLVQKLELIQQARDDIQTALEDKGQVVGKDIRDYAEAVSNITTREDLTAELTAQTQKLAELEALLDNKTQGEAKPNIFCQLEEPSSKDGIWLQTDKEYDIVNFADSPISHWETTKEADTPYDIGTTQGGKSGIIAVDDYIYFFGGSNSNTQTLAYKYNINTKLYTRLTDIPYNFSGNLIYIDGHIYLIGGYPNYYKMTKYDIENNSYITLSDIPYPVNNASITSVGTDIYLFGGEGNSSWTSWYTKAYKYDTLTDTYTQLQDLSGGTFRGCAVTVGTDIYLFDGEHTWKSLYKYDTLTNSCIKLGNRTIPLYCEKSRAFYFNGDIYILLGQNATSVYKYSIDNNTFTLIEGSENSSFSNYRIACMKDNIIYVVQQTKLYKFIVVDNEDKSVIVSQKSSDYTTHLFNKSNNMKNNAKFSFDNVWYYTIQDGLDDTIPTYYGDGTQWINFKNPPVEEVEE